MVPNLIQRACSPCFVYRPDALARACWRKLRSRPERCVVKTAWGDLLEVQPRKLIGAHLYMRGVHELAVCEVLWRLAQQGEQAIDVGANIGVMTSLLSKRVGPNGRVLAFEPHPEIYRQLEQNAGRWNRGNMLLMDFAISATTGTAQLQENPNFNLNEGTASITSPTGFGRCFEVKTARLSDVLPEGSCGVLKIDVEGHEDAVLAGTETSFQEARLRDVVFESSWFFPGAAHQRLLSLGLHIFEITHSFRGPVLARIRSRPAEPGRTADYLATADPVRAQTLIEPAGWKVLRI